MSDAPGDDTNAPPHRYNAASRERDRGALAGLLGRAPHLLDAESRGPPGGRLRRDARPGAAVRARHVPVPERCRAPRRPSARLHRHRRVRALPPHERSQRDARSRVRRVRAAGRAVRARDGPAPPGGHRGQHRDDAAPAARPGSRARLAPQRVDDRRRRTTGGRSGSSSRSSAPGTTTRPTAPARSPSSRPSSRRERGSLRRRRTPTGSRGRISTSGPDAPSSTPTASRTSRKHP